MHLYLLAKFHLTFFTFLMLFPHSVGVQAQAGQTLAQLGANADEGG